MIYVRLVRHDDPLSWAIIQNIGGVVAHAEAVMKGGTVIGAFAEGGVQERPIGYDGGKFVKEILFELPADDAMTAKFEHFMRAIQGEAYDFSGIINFVHLGYDFHAKHHVFCSAAVHDGLRWCEYYPRPTPMGGHYVTPLVLHQQLLVDVRTRIVERSDPAFVAHIAPHV
jgi:hypothetical protein